LSAVRRRKLKLWLFLTLVLLALLLLAAGGMIVRLTSTAASVVAGSKSRLIKGSDPTRPLVGRSSS
jgi:membrane protein implicated in regulation of membrane protease activity